MSILEFPITADSTWQTESDITGVAVGILGFYDETYTTTFAGEGLLKTPFGEFPVIRLRTDLERVVGLLQTTTRTYSFVSECFGTVATITSDDNESEVEFTHAAELRRLAP